VVNKRLFLIIAITYTIAILVLSLASNSTMPRFGTNYEDKIYHLLAYGLLNLLWYKVLFEFKIKHPIGIALVASIIYGIIVEVFQGQYTVARDPSIMDCIANSIGAMIVSLFLTLKKKTIVKKI